MKITLKKNDFAPVVLVFGWARANHRGHRPRHVGRRKDDVPGADVQPSGRLVSLLSDQVCGVGLSLSLSAVILG